MPASPAAPAPRLRVLAPSRSSGRLVARLGSARRDASVAEGLLRSHDELAAFSGLSLMVGMTICFGPADRLLGGLAAITASYAVAESHFQRALALAERSAVAGLDGPRPARLEPSCSPASGEDREPARRGPAQTTCGRSSRRPGAPTALRQWPSGSSPALGLTDRPPSSVLAAFGRPSRPNPRGCCLPVSQAGDGGGGGGPHRPRRASRTRARRRRRSAAGQRRRRTPAPRRAATSTSSTPRSRAAAGHVLGRHGPRRRRGAAHDEVVVVAPGSASSMSCGLAAPQQADHEDPAAERCEVVLEHRRRTPRRRPGCGRRRRSRAVGGRAPRTGPAPSPWPKPSSTTAVVERRRRRSSRPR